MSYTGKTVKFVLIEIKDYEILHDLRQSDGARKFLHAADDDPITQKIWLENYKKKEALGLELYFLIKKIETDEVVGAIRAYNLNRETGLAYCGSWILNQNKTLSSAVESILLICEELEKIGIKKIIVDTRKDNKSVQKFIKRIASNFIGEKNGNLFYEIDGESIMANFYKNNKWMVGS